MDNEHASDELEAELERRLARMESPGCGGAATGIINAPGLTPR
ncbi:hypothetical protein ACXR2W_01990 [Leucobacter sp. HY1908]